MYYCNRACQVKNWPKHKRNCQKSIPKQPQTASISLIQEGHKQQQKLQTSSDSSPNSQPSPYSSKSDLPSFVKQNLQQHAQQNTTGGGSKQKHNGGFAKSMNRTRLTKAMCPRGLTNFLYRPSPDGYESNLLILFHGTILPYITHVCMCVSVCECPYTCIYDGNNPDNPDNPQVWVILSRSMINSQPH